MTTHLDSNNVIILLNVDRCCNSSREKSVQIHKRNIKELKSAINVEDGIELDKDSDRSSVCLHQVSDLEDFSRDRDKRQETRVFETCSIR